MKRKKIFLVCGARPNFVKISPLWDEIRRHGACKPLIVHTGQHYDYAMEKIFFRELKIPTPHFYLGASNLTRLERMVKIMTSFETLCKKEKPSLIVVVGDVDSTLACALVSLRLAIRLAHIESGLRSFDMTMPEEINRIITDHLSDILFTSCIDGNENLKQEGITHDKIFFVGNIMIDTLRHYKRKASTLKTYKKIGSSRRYALLTLHRPENVDNKRKLQKIFMALREIAKKMPIIFPCHPRTSDKIKQFKIAVDNHITITSPLGYLEFLNLMMHCRCVLTDSGGIQEEATYLKLPCLTLRNNTERPITVTEGSNILVGTEKENIVQAFVRILRKNKKKNRIPLLWDGKTAKRTVKKLLDII